jgi:NADH-ubiquinone oxidoreductase chain 2
MPKISILILLLEIFCGGQLGSVVYPLTLNGNELSFGQAFSEASISYVFKNLLLFSSLLSLVIGTVVGLAQKKIKRLLAYSTISHVGFILLALAINTEYSIESFLFYIIQYTYTNLNVFLIILSIGVFLNKANLKVGNLSNGGAHERAHVGRGFKLTQIEMLDVVNISELAKLYNYLPVLALSFCICLFSMAGVPPFIGFFSKQFVLYSAVQSGYYFLSIVGILTSVISASYYLKLIKTMYDSSIQKGEENSSSDSDLNIKLHGDNYGIVFSHLQSFTISILTLSIIFFIIKPSIILNSVQLLSLSLFLY